MSILDPAVLTIIGGAFSTALGAWVGAWYVQHRTVRALQGESADLRAALGRVKSESQSAREHAAVERTRSDQRHDQLKRQLAANQQAVVRLREIQAALGRSTLVQERCLPVLLAGPRNVGKTSLMMRWEAPWETYDLRANVSVRCAEVPILQYMEAKKVKHHADESILVNARTHLLLRVFDFPGELSVQQHILETARLETAELRKTRAGTGIVLICMFDGSSGRDGASEYYTAQFVQDIRTLLVSDAIKVDQIVAVFNKVDLLPLPTGNVMDDDAILNRCRDVFESELRGLRTLVHPERFALVATMLQRESAAPPRGSEAVKGYACRAFVATFAGEAVEKLRRTQAAAVPANGPTFT